MKPHDENLLVSLAVYNCLTDLPYTLEYWIFINWTLDSRHTILWVSPETITPDFIQLSRHFIQRKSIESQLKAPTQSSDSFVFAVTRQTSIQFDGNVSARKTNSITHALEFRLSCTNPSTCGQSTALVLDRSAMCLRCTGIHIICCDVADDAIWVLADRNRRYWRMFLKTYHFCGYEIVLRVCISLIC